MEEGGNREEREVEREVEEWRRAGTGGRERRGEGSGSEISSRPH